MGNCVTIIFHFDDKYRSKKFHLLKKTTRRRIVPMISPMREGSVPDITFIFCLICQPRTASTTPGCIYRSQSEKS